MRALIILFLFSIVNITVAQDQVIGTEIKDFRLLSTDGDSVSLSDFPDAKGFIIIFTSNHCPFAKLYPQRLNDLHNIFSVQQVPLLAIRSTDVTLMKDDSFEKMQKLARLENLEYPYLADDSQETGRNFKAEKTPHAFVIWKVNNKWIIRYSGAIDDNGAEPENVKRAYVKEAVDSLLLNRDVTIPVTKSVGCVIKYRPSEK
jgi:peroxiredoxin